MAAWWKPTADGYFQHVPKAAILEAVGAFAPSNVTRLAKLKKGDIASEAERLADGTGWMPAVFLDDHHRAGGRAGGGGRSGCAGRCHRGGGRARAGRVRQCTAPARSAGFLSEPGAAVAAPGFNVEIKIARCRLRPGGNGRTCKCIARGTAIGALARQVSMAPAAMGGACGATPRLAAAGCTKACRPRRWRFRSTTSRRTGHEHAARPRLWSFHATPQHVAASGDKGRSRFVVEGWPCPRQGTGRCSRHAGSRVGHFSIRDRAAPASLSCCESWRWRGCGLHGRNLAAKTISPALRAFLAGQILFASRFSTSFRPQAVRPAHPRRPDHNKDAMGATLFNRKEKHHG